MASRELFLWKFAWKIRDTFQLSKILVAFIPIVCQSWLLPGITHLLQSPWLSQVFQGQQEQQIQLFTAPCSHLSPSYTGKSWHQPVLGIIAAEVAKSSSRHISEKPWSCWEGWCLGLLYSALPCSVAVFSSYPSTSKADKQNFCVWEEGTHHEARNY